MHTLRAVAHPNHATIAALRDAYVSGQATAVSVCQAHLDRIAAYDRKGPALNAIIMVNPNALATADALDARLARSGPAGM